MGADEAAGVRTALGPLLPDLRVLRWLFHEDEPAGLGGPRRAQGANLTAPTRSVSAVHVLPSPSGFVAGAPTRRDSGSRGRGLRERLLAGREQLQEWSSPGRPASQPGTLGWWRPLAARGLRRPQKGVPGVARAARVGIGAGTESRRGRLPPLPCFGYASRPTGRREPAAWEPRFDSRWWHFRMLCSWDQT